MNKITNLNFLVVADDQGLAETIQTKLVASGVHRERVKLINRRSGALRSVLEATGGSGLDGDLFFQAIVIELFDDIEYERKNGELLRTIRSLSLGGETIINIWAFEPVPPEVASIYAVGHNETIIRRRFTDALTAQDVLDEIIKLRNSKT